MHIIVLFVAFLAAVSKTFGGSHLTQVEVFAILTGIMDDSVPLILRLELPGVCYILLKKKRFHLYYYEGSPKPP